MPIQCGKFAYVNFYYMWFVPSPLLPRLQSLGSWTVGVSACMSASALEFTITQKFTPTFLNETWIGENWVPSTEPDDLFPLSLLKSVVPNQDVIEQVLRELEQL